MNEEGRKAIPDELSPQLESKIPSGEMRSSREASPSAPTSDYERSTTSSAEPDNKFILAYLLSMLYLSRKKIKRWSCQTVSNTFLLTPQPLFHDNHVRDNVSLLGNKSSPDHCENCN